MTTPTNPDDGDDFDIAEYLITWLDEQDRRRHRPTTAEIVEDVLNAEPPERGGDRDQS